MVSVSNARRAVPAGAGKLSSFQLGTKAPNIRKIIRIFCSSIFILIAPYAEANNSKIENRCGWVNNPTPANWSLVDRDGEWTIAVQGGHQAQGDLPDFGKHWVENNAHYGYGCACLKVSMKKNEKKILKISGFKVFPIERCKSDKSLDQKHK
ncbi:MAG: DUF4087 domain-containing protein [Proteobacteria bacterium]|nr:MAG: DUF4087 domain-containing protein [Pseudomonadota bacterium]